jgi:hypothetical protein
VVRLLSSPDTKPEAMGAIVQRAASLPAERATLWIQLLATVERTGSEAARTAAEAVRLAENRDPRGGVRVLEAGLNRGPPSPDRPPLMALAAFLLDEVDPARAAELRRRLIREWPDALETPEAQVLLARHLLVREGARGAGEAREVLESLLVRRPNHPLAPEARRLRQEALRGRPGNR